MVEQKVTDFINHKKDKLVQRLANTQALDRQDYEDKYIRFARQLRKNQIPISDGPMGDFIAAFNKLDSGSINKERANAIQVLANQFGIELTLPQPVVDLDPLIDVLKNAYPLLAKRLKNFGEDDLFREWAVYTNAKTNLIKENDKWDIRM